MQLQPRLSGRQKRERGVFLTGQCAGAISDIKPAGQIVEEMVQQAFEQLNSAPRRILVYYVIDISLYICLIYYNCLIK